jgi:hypothetical protein
MTEHTNAGRSARIGEDELDHQKSTEPTLIDRILNGAVGGALSGLVESIAGELDQPEQGYHASLDDGRVEVTYVPEVGDERLVMSLSVDHANELYQAVSSDGESERYHIEPTASGEVLDIYDEMGTPIDIPALEILANDRDSLEHALASVLEDHGAADLLEGVKGVFVSDNDFEVLDGERVKVSYQGDSVFHDDELAALRDSEYWISAINPDNIIVKKEGSADV